MPEAPSLEALKGFIDRHKRLFVLTGAGVSTGSGIPDYRDADGQWKRAQPVTIQAFLAAEPTRRRYWARSLLGWPRVQAAQPNPAHYALARLEARGQVELLLTQNVDGLHQRAGSHRVSELHGTLATVHCLTCGHRLPRAEMQDMLFHANPGWVGIAARFAPGTATAPDGDADLEGEEIYEGFVLPPCPVCGSRLLKPDVVFFGENVPLPRVEAAFAALGKADALLVVGSSLMVFSGFRFTKAAAEQGLPIAAITLGRTRADDLLALKVDDTPCAEALAFAIGSTLADEPI